MSQHFLHVVGARPNFMKAAPVVRALDARGATQTLVHTGQHYDANMSGVFFSQLGLRHPDVNLEVGSGSHARQTGEIMVGLETSLEATRPDAVIVYGDVNSTVASALVCAKAGIKLIHVEAGLRSGDRSMPEEINRIVTDRLADLLLTPSADANENLRAEGVPAEQIVLVGNVMIDTLARLRSCADARSILAGIGIGEQDPFGLVTLHRPSNVDDLFHLAATMTVLEQVAEVVPIVFPVHPRTRARLAGFTTTGLHLLEPLGYLEFLDLQSRAAFVVTDSGGIQEETTYLGVPCLTLRDTTERPITVIHGTNRLVGRNPTVLRREIQRLLDGDRPAHQVPPLWDGHAAERIADVLLDRSAARRIS